MEKFSLLRKNDIILVLVLLLLAVAGLFVFRIVNGGQGKTVLVTVDGELFGEYELGMGADEPDFDAVVGGEGYIAGGLNQDGGNTDTSEKINGTGEGFWKKVVIKGKIGECIMVIEDGKVYMQEADCPNQICVHHTPISHRGETIVCLPNRIVIEID